MLGSVTIDSPVDYFQFPELCHLCEVREIRGNIVKYCPAIARDGAQVCVWHENLRDYHRNDGRNIWAGLDVTYAPG